MQNPWLFHPEKKTEKTSGLRSRSLQIPPQGGERPPLSEKVTGSCNTVR